MAREISRDAVVGPQQPALRVATPPYQLRTSSLTPVVFTIVSLNSTFREICLTGALCQHRFDHLRNIKPLLPPDGSKTRDRRTRRPCPGNPARAVPIAGDLRPRGAACRGHRGEARRDALLAVLSPPAARPCRSDHATAV